MKCYTIFAFLSVVAVSSLIANVRAQIQNAFAETKESSVGTIAITPYDNIKNLFLNVGAIDAKPCYNCRGSCAGSGSCCLGPFPQCCKVDGRCGCCGKD